jgi:hypothetical protein
MADKKAIYAPGELDKVKNRLGPIDEKEAKRLQKVLGGEVGHEKSDSDKPAGSASHRSGKSSGGGGRPVGGKPKHTVEVAPTEGETGNKTKNAAPRIVTAGIPNYLERVKMDMCAGETEFGIKTPWQVFISRISFFRTPPDLVSSWFVKDRLNEYYSQIETLVTSVRLMFPRNNLERNTKVQKISPYAFNVLNVMRQIRIDLISSEIGKIQAHPRNAQVREFIVMLREIYKPIYLLENLSVDKHINEAFNILYKISFVDNPNAETEKMLRTISTCLAAWQYISGKVRLYLYPLLMKLLSTFYEPYDLFFAENEDRISAFLGLKNEDKIHAPANVAIINDVQKDDFADGKDEENELSQIEEFSDKTVAEQKTDQAEAKVVEHGLKILENLFPKAGWSALNTFPDFYPYFADVLEMKKNSDILSPEDPVQLALVLSQCIEELLYGFRAIQFSGNDANGKPIGAIIDDWHNTLTSSFDKQYLPRVSEYAHFFEHSGSSRTSTYAVNLVTDIHWLRRYYFLPYYDYKSPTPPSFKKNDVVALYPLVRHLRKELTTLAASIDASNKAGGQSAKMFVEGIKNPWDPYVFEVNNPLSIRLNFLLPRKQRTNVSLLFFTLAIITVLDNHLNNQNSVAYNTDNEKVFRCSDAEGKVPVLWVDKKSNTMALFKQAIAAKQARG